MNDEARNLLPHGARRFYREDLLSPDRVRALESVKGWVWDPFEANWQEGFDYLMRFVKRERHARVPNRYTEDGYKLGSWVSIQRMAYNRDTLSPARIRALETVRGWVWDPYEADWQEGLNYLKRFVKREKHARVPAKHIEDGYKLGIWVTTQRSTYRSDLLSPDKDDLLSPDRVQALEAIKGWVWDALEADWQEGLDYLKRFVKREKHARVPSGHIEDGYKLGRWVVSQRAKKNSLTPARVKALESLKGWVWDSLEAKWQEKLDCLKRFVKREKHARVPNSHIEDGFRLGKWVGKQRDRKNSLSPARIRALESVKGWVWDSREAKWQEGLDYLKRFVKREKHARVPAKHIEDGYKLGIWVTTQRSTYRDDLLSPDRVRALESVRGWIWDAR